MEQINTNTDANEIDTFSNAVQPTPEEISITVEHSKSHKEASETKFEGMKEELQ